MIRRLLFAAMVLAPAGAAADGWLVAEAPAAVAVSDAQSGVFRPGAMPAFGAYADNGWFALGARVRGGVLRNGPSPGQGLEDPGMGGLFTAGLAMRVHAKGAWAELVGGGGVTGDDLVPAVEAGVGYTFPVGDYEIGPGARFVRVINRDDMAAFGSADLLLFGVDVRFGVDHVKRSPRVEQRIVVAPAPVPVEAVVGPVTDDGDFVTEAREASCAEKLDGCPLFDHAQMFEDRIVLDERVLFDFGRARVRSNGRALINEIAKLWKQHPDWRRITVAGHTDVRGSDTFNQTLSEERAARARDVLLKQGFDAAQIDAVGYGRSRPLVEARDEAQHHKNRRVEFVIDRQVSVSEASK